MVFSIYTFLIKGAFNFGNEINERTYYVVTSGREIGIYRKKEKALEQVNGYPNSKMKKIKGLKQAREYFMKNRVKEKPVYYVVTVGRNKGLYKDYDKALEQVKGFSNGHMKKVVGYREAKAYLETYHQQEEKKNVPIIYTDGSYDQAKGLSGYGYVVCIEGKIIFQDGGIILDSDMINLQSLGSEVFALLRAMEWSISNGYKEIKVIYDSVGIISLITNGNDSKAKKSRGRTKFISVYEKYTQYLMIHFQHRSENELFKHYHTYAHNLSRLPVGLLSS